MAYAINGLKEKLKKAGLEILEKDLLVLLTVTTTWAEDEAKKGEHGLVDLGVLAIAPQARELGKTQIDKIDGEKNL